MFRQRTVLFSNFINQVCCIKSVVKVTVLLCMLVSSSHAIDVNKCITSGQYLDITSSKTNIKKPEDLTMKEVSNKRCGFEITGSLSTCGELQVNFVAVEVAPNSADDFCSFWDQTAICACSFYGCNSASGVFYKTLLDSLNTAGKLVGKDYANTLKPDSSVTDAYECLFKKLDAVYFEKEQTNVTRLEAANLKNDAPAVQSLRATYPKLFPDQNQVNQLINDGKLAAATTAKPTTTTPKTTKTLPVTSGKPSTKGPSNQSNNRVNKDPKSASGKADEDSSGAGTSLAVNIFLVLLNLALVVLVVWLVFCTGKREGGRALTRTPSTETARESEMGPPPSTQDMSTYAISPSSSNMQVRK